MEQQFVVSQNDIVDLFCLHIQSNGNQTAKGTYNAGDPTHFEKWYAVFGIEYGYTSEPIDPEEGGKDGWEYPQPENVKVFIHDVTWGLEIEIHTSVGVEKGYWSRTMFGEKGRWCRSTPNFFNRMRDVWMNGREADFWEIEEHLQKMGYYSCE